ncbi:MAG: nickel-dependent lactate racemase [Methylobacteriaceae bacterium]|jgi:nickel-dependent lactate racemase|nr:nickel-dependent lactate racemase [Methylobacteriaceae bacterium]
MNHELAYGKGKLSFTLPGGVTPTIIVAGDRPALPDPHAAADFAVKNPEGTPPLVEMLRARAPKSVVVIVNDVTRPTPYDVILPPLLNAFSEAGVTDEQVTFLVATGVHDVHTDAQNREFYGDAIVDRFKVVSHNAEARGTHTLFGKVISGYDFWVNTLAVEADFLITVGVVMPHYFAGYSGGRKSILPGVVGKETVEKNHARMVELMDNLPPIDENPVSLEMIDAARKVGVDFILNVVMNDRKEVVSIHAGDLVKAWRSAVTVSASIFEVPFDKQVDICITCASGYPRDINAYQAQKALDHADRITRPGGTIVLAAECPMGYGERVFEEWMSRGWTPRQVMEEVKRHFVIGGHKAYGFAKVAAEKEYWLISSFNERDTQRLYAKKAATVQEAVDAAFVRHGPQASCVYMPQGSVSLPVLRQAAK